MHRPLLTLLLLLAPLATAATDISGKWSGSMDRKTPDGKVDSTPVIAEFRLDGKTVTGTANVPGFDPLPVGNGMLQGDRLTFEVHGDDGDYAVKLTLVGESQLKGEVVFSARDGTRQTSSLTFTRNKYAAVTRSSVKKLEYSHAASCLPDCCRVFVSQRNAMRLCGHRCSETQKRV